MVHKCGKEGCNAQIDDKYLYCIAHKDLYVAPAGEAKASTGTSAELIKVLGMINANLYCLRQLKAAELEAEHKIVLELDAESGKYEKRKVGKVAKK